MEHAVYFHVSQCQRRTWYIIHSEILGRAPADGHGATWVSTSYTTTEGYIQFYVDLLTLYGWTTVYLVADLDGPAYNQVVMDGVRKALVGPKWNVYIRRINSKNMPNDNFNNLLLDFSRVSRSR